MSYQTEPRDRPIQTIVGAICDTCLKPLEPVCPAEDGTWTVAQARGALDLTLAGGYGQFFDGRPVRLVLCRGCADRLVSTLPRVGEAMKEAEGMGVIQ